MTIRELFPSINEHANLLESYLLELWFDVRHAHPTIGYGKIIGLGLYAVGTLLIAYSYDLKKIFWILVGILLIANVSNIAAIGDVLELSRAVCGTVVWGFCLFVVCGRRLEKAIIKQTTRVSRAFWIGVTVLLFGLSGLTVQQYIHDLSYLEMLMHYLILGGLPMAIWLFISSGSGSSDRHDYTITDSDGKVVGHIDKD